MTLTTISNTTRRMLTGVVTAGILAAFLTSCTSISVKSNPPGARVVWSKDGMEPYNAWPPNSWEIQKPSKGESTPFTSRGTFGDTIFVTVEKDGYRRPLPKPAELYFWRAIDLDFELEELPETRAARYRAEGKLYYQGRWVDPKVEGLEEVDGVVMTTQEAFVLRQKAAGLIEYEGEWLTAAQAIERKEAAMLAAGLISFKDRWVTPEVRAGELAVDEEVLGIKNSSKYEDLSPPRLLGRVSMELAQVQFYNSTGQQVRYLISGPVSREIVLEPYRSAGIRADNQVNLPPGRYDIVVVPTGKDASGRDLLELLSRTDQMTSLQLSTTPQWASWPLQAYSQYSFNFTGGQQDIKEGLENFTPAEPKLNFTPPVIDIPEVKLPEREAPQRPTGDGAPQGTRTRQRPTNP